MPWTENRLPAGGPLRHSWTAEGEERLDSFLRQKLPPLFPGEEDKKQLSNSKIRRLIVAGCVQVDGRQCRRPAFVLRPKSRVLVELDTDRLFYEKDNGDIDFTLTEKDVLFEDEFIIVVNKPAFLPTEETMVKGRGNMHQAVIDYLWRKSPSLRNPPYAGIMHRLDRETSGALLFTKARAVNRAVHDSFERHLVKKQYRAVCTASGGAALRQPQNGDASRGGAAGGRLPPFLLQPPLPLQPPPPYRFSVDDFIGRVSPRSSACKMGELPEEKGGLHAHTDFMLAQAISLLGRAEAGGPAGRELFYFDCQLGTGRTHQIRLHLSLSGFPIVGDVLYGGVEGFSENGGRVMLHARSLELPHPVTGLPVRCEAPLPPLFGLASGSD